MHIKMLNDLQSTDVTNTAQTKKVLGKVHNEIIYFRKIKNLNQIKLIGDTLGHFLSTNSNQIYQNMSTAYRTKQFFANLSYLLSLCLSILEQS